MIKNKEKTNFEFLDEPRFDIGQTVYVPTRTGAVQTNISGYEVQVIKQGTKLVGIISNYRLQQSLVVRRGEGADLTDLFKESGLYVNRAKARIASEFIAVTMDGETWRLAIGDRNEKDENSPYNIDNCGLSTCCANISDARDILTFCKREGGLIVHEQRTLAELLRGHDFKYTPESPLGKILSQLKIRSS